MNAIDEYLELTEDTIDKIECPDDAISEANRLHTLQQTVAKWRRTLPDFGCEDLNQYMDAAMEELDGEIGRLSEYAHKHCMCLCEDIEEEDRYRDDLEKDYRAGVL